MHQKRCVEQNFSPKFAKTGHPIAYACEEGLLDVNLVQLVTAWDRIKASSVSSSLAAPSETVSQLLPHKSSQTKLHRRHDLESSASCHVDQLSFRNGNVAHAA